MTQQVERVQFQSPQRQSQATMVEQSRAVAEVQAAVVVAQQIPRVVALSVAEMEESCKQPELAEKAFFALTVAALIVDDALIVDVAARKVEVTGWTGAVVTLSTVDAS